MWNEYTENLIADEFSSELADGVAYVSGYDDDSRPVLVSFLSPNSHSLCPCS